MDYAWAFSYLKKKIKSSITYGIFLLTGSKPIPFTIDGVTVLFKPLSSYQCLWAVGVVKNYERGPLLLWKRLASSSELIADVGGYAGIYGLLAAKTNPAAQVYIFEPDIFNCKQIQENIRVNNVKNITLIQAVAADKPGEVAFSFHDGGTGGFISTNGAKVPAVTLSRYGQFDLVKICAHGSELKVLQGALPIRNLILKVYTDFQTKETLQELWRLLEKRESIPIDQLAYRTIYYVK
jgi:FkbM family methyltransferase